MTVDASDRTGPGVSDARAKAVSRLADALRISPQAARQALDTGGDYARTVHLWRTAPSPEMELPYDPGSDHWINAWFLDRNHDVWYRLGWQGFCFHTTLYYGWIAARHGKRNITRVYGRRLIPLALMVTVFLCLALIGFGVQLALLAHGGR